MAIDFEWNSHGKGWIARKVRRKLAWHEHKGLAYYDRERMRQPLQPIVHPKGFEGYAAPPSWAAVPDSWGEWEPQHKGKHHVVSQLHSRHERRSAIRRGRANRNRLDGPLVGHVRIRLDHRASTPGLLARTVRRRLQSPPAWPRTAGVSNGPAPRPCGLADGSSVIEFMRTNHGNLAFATHVRWVRSSKAINESALRSPTTRSPIRPSNRGGFSRCMAL
jgi:hypothetical protein